MLRPMRLEGALKLYIGLYVLALIPTLLTTIPMLLAIGPNSKTGCLLFAPLPRGGRVQYGGDGGCIAAGLLPIAVAFSIAGLIFVHWLQLRKLRKHVKLPEMSSDEFRSAFKSKFWTIIVIHGIVTGVVLVIGAILISGYVTTCQNFYLSIAKKLRFRLDMTPGQATNQRSRGANEVFEDDFTIQRYLNNQQDFLGRNKFEEAITCRSIFTDKKLHYDLKLTQGKDPYTAQYAGFWNQIDDNTSDVGNFENIAYIANLYLELAIAGPIIGLLILIPIFILMLVEQHHLKGFITDESMWGGSNYGGYGEGSVRSGRSRKSSAMNGRMMSPIDFENMDKMSDYSRVSKASRSSRGTSYKDMGRKKPGASANSYKNMGRPSSVAGSVRNGQSEPPSQLTVSRLEQVPQVDRGYTVKRLLNPEMNTSVHSTPLPPHMRNPNNETQSVADMSVLTVTGAVIGPGVNRPMKQSRPYHSSHQPGPAHSSQPRQQGRRSTGGGGGLMDYFGGGTGVDQTDYNPDQPRCRSGDAIPEQSSTGETDLM